MDDEDDNFFEQFSDGNASDILLDFDEENSDVEEIEFEDDYILDIDNLAYTFYEEKHVIFVNAMELVRDVLIHVINVKKHCAKFMSQKTFAQLVDHL